LVQKQITDALDAELAKKGLTKTDADSADLYIAYQTAIGGMVRVGVAVGTAAWVQP